MNLHSTIVAWTKVLLPLMALALLATLFLFARAPDPEAALPFVEMDIGTLTDAQRLSEPRFAGTLGDGREITLEAAIAATVANQPNMIELETVVAEVELSGQDALRLTADAGTFDMAGQQADLNGNVVLISVRGLELLSDAMSVAMSQLHVISPGPVRVSGPGLRIEAGAMDLTEGTGGDGLVSFTGGVHLIYDSSEVE